MRAHQVLIIVLLWSAYFALHSVLASLWVKNRIARRHAGFMPYYRLFFNVTATVLLLPILWFLYAERGDYLWQWRGPLFWVANGLALLAVAGFLWTLRYYSGEEFIGVRQWREHELGPEEQERFVLSPLHRFVRHPWYFLGLVIIWTRDMDVLFLTTAVTVTAYLYIGSRLEEKKLLRYHGDVYRRYRERVPGLIPLPGRWLSREEARRLMAEGARKQSAAQ